MEPETLRLINKNCRHNNDPQYSEVYPKRHYELRISKVKSELDKDKFQQEQDEDLNDRLHANQGVQSSSGGGNCVLLGSVGAHQNPSSYAAKY